MPEDEETDAWVQRIGAEAARVRRKAGPIVFGVVSAGIGAIGVAALVGRVASAPEQYGAVLLVVSFWGVVPLVMSAMVVGTMLRRRAGTLAAQHIHLSRYSTYKTVPTMYLVRPDRFDDFMVIAGVPQTGSYVAHPSPVAFETARRHSDRILNPPTEVPGVTDGSGRDITAAGSSRSGLSRSVYFGGALILGGVGLALVGAIVVLIGTFQGHPQGGLVLALFGSCVLCYIVGVPLIYVRRPH